MHKEQKVYVPTLIFGHLLTSSNYNDDEKKVTGGRNGYGAKLCNIFSTKFVVETCSSDSGKKFKQVLSYIYIQAGIIIIIQVQVLLLNLCMAFNKTLSPGYIFCVSECHIMNHFLQCRMHKDYFYSFKIFGCFVALYPQLQ